MRAINFFSSQDRFLKSAVSVSVLCIFLILLTYAVVFSHLPAKLPLYYSRPWGSVQLVAKIEFLILPAIIVVISLVNAAIFWQLHSSQLILKRSLMLTTIFIDIIILVTALKILFTFI